MAGKFKRGNIWWVSWESAAGRCRVTTGTTDERKAELLRRAKELELELGRPVIVDDSAPTLEELAVLFLEYQGRAVGSAARNAQSLNTHIIPHFGTIRVTEITRSAVKAWVLDRLETASAGTVKRDLATLRRMFSLAIEWGILASNPAARVKVPQADDVEGDVRWYTKEQLALLYDDPERGNIWKFYANTGLRRNEGLYLRLEDIDSDRIRIVSRKGARTKSRRSRVVPLNKSAQDAIAALRGDRDYLLPRYHAHTLTHYFTAYARSAGLPGSLHWLRHSFGHHWVKSGRSLRQLQLIMGHSSYSVTERYARMDTGELDVAGFEV